MPRHNKTIDDLRNNTARKIKELRVAKGLSRQQLANKIDVTHQQLKKYEDGDNAISSSRLQLIAHVLGAKISYLYEDPLVNDDSNNRMMMEISRKFKNIKNPAKRRAALDIITALAS